MTMTSYSRMREPHLLWSRAAMGRPHSRRANAAARGETPRANAELYSVSATPHESGKRLPPPSVAFFRTEPQVQLETAYPARIRGLVRENAQPTVPPSAEVPR